MKFKDIHTEAANPAQQAAIAIAKKKKAGMVKEQQLDEFAPLLALGARLFMAAAPKIAQVVGRAGQAGARGAGQAARAGTEIAAKNAGSIGMGAGAYEIGSSVADIAKDIAAKVGTAIDEETVLDLAALAFKYAIPAGIVLAVLYGGKKAIDSLFDDPKAQPGMAEDAVSDFLARGGQVQQGKLHKPRKGETWQGSSHIGAAGGRGTKGTVSGKAANTNPKGGKPVVSAEGYNPEYDDEAGMADNNLETLQRAVEGIDDLIQSGDNLPEWCQEKIAVAKSMLVAVWDYMYSEEATHEVDPVVDEMFEALQELVAEMAVKNRVSEDLVWEQFEAMPDNVLYETAAWRRKEGKSKKGGLNAKGVASYRRENPGSKLQMAVTTKPSKLKKGSKASKRRKSFCARMSGVKGPMKKPNGKPTRKALALRKWNC
jgi:hypothetical protein